MQTSTHILIAEDETLVASALAIVLESEGYRVTVTHDGLQALDAAAQDAPDLLMTDLRMPLLHGADLVERIRQGRPELPVVVMTGYSDRIPPAEPGRLVVLRKPFRVPTLVDTVKAMLGA